MKTTKQYTKNSKTNKFVEISKEERDEKEIKLKDKIKEIENEEERKR
jgi:hypothetical protein